MNSRTLEMYSFWWSELRLLIAAAALFLGGVPPIYYFVPTFPSAVVTVAWIISGIAAGFLLYRWYDDGQKLFGRKDHKDTLAFLILAVSGLNLGFAGVFGRNIGMSITSNYIFFIIVAFAYLFAAWHLWVSAKKNKGRLF